MRQLLYSMLVTEGDQAAQKVCTYLHTYIHTYVHTYVRIYMYKHTYIHTVHTYVCTYVHTCTHTVFCAWYTEVSKRLCPLCIWSTCTVSMLAVCCGASAPPLTRVVPHLSRL